MVQVQTPQGPQLIPIEVARQHGLLEQWALPQNLDAEQLHAAQRIEASAERNTPSMEALIEQDLRRQAKEAKAAQAATAEAPLTPYVQGAEVDTMARAKMTGMKLLQQKKGRKGIKALIERLNQADEAEWDEIVMGFIMENIDIYHYIQAVSYYAAMAEGNAGEELADKVAEKLRAHALVPDDIIYTEDDWATAQTAPSEEGA